MNAVLHRALESARRTPRARLVLAGAAIAVVAVLGLRARTVSETSAPSLSSNVPAVESIPAVTGDGRYGFLFNAPPSPGASFEYAFTWSEKAQNFFLTAAKAPGAIEQAESGMRGKLTLTTLVSRDAHLVMTVEVGAVQPLAQDPRSTEIAAMLAKEITGSVGYLVFHPDGALQSIRFAEGTPSAFSNFVQRLAGILLHARPTAPEREVVTTETTPFGIATTKYEAREGGQLYRTRVAYTKVAGLPHGADVTGYGQELESGALFTFRQDGALAALGDTESLRVTKDGESEPAVDDAHGFSLKLEDAHKAEGEAAPARLGSLATHVPWEATIDPAAERKAVEDRLEGLTAPVLMTHVRAVAALGDKAPDQLKFFNRATGFLKLHPETAAAFVDLIHEPKMTYPGRAFALDILASAGNDVAQAALVKALRDPRTRALPEYFSLYQRVALVRAPSDATVGFAQESFDRLHGRAAKGEAEEDLRTATVYTLGSVAGHMAATRRQEGAERICARLAAEMHVDEAKRAHRNAYITALGNAGLPSQEPLLLRLSDDEDLETRVTGLNALRKYDTALSRGRVMSVLTAKVGATPKVDFPTQAEALRAYMLMTPSRADVKLVADAIVKDTLHRDLYGDTLALFRKGKAPLADVSPALDAMFERSKEHDDDLQTRIDTLRAELSAIP